MHSDFEQVVQYCLENPDNLSTDDLLARFPEYREELQPLLALDARLKDSLPGSMLQQSKSAMKQRLVDVAARQAAEPARETPAPQPATERPRVASRPWWRNRLFAGAATAILVALVWWLSATSLPDSLFYPAKLTTENSLLTFSGGGSNLVRGHINLANIRLLDIGTMQDLGKIDSAGPAFDNYRYHLNSCLDLWKQPAISQDTDVARLLYVSTKAGERLFAGVEAAADRLPEQVQSNIRETITGIDDLNASTGQRLRQSGVDLDRLLQETRGDLAQFLTPVAGAPTPTRTPVPTSSPAASPVTSAIPAPTLTAVLWTAQTVIAGGGDSTTPAVAAAETVAAVGTGTPVLSAVETVLANPPFTGTLVIPPPPTLVSTLVPTFTLESTLPAVPTLTPLLSTPPGGAARSAATPVTLSQPPATPVITLTVPPTGVPALNLDAEKPLQDDTSPTPALQPSPY